MYEFFLNMLNEFDTYWRIPNLSIPYDFQYRAKLVFENDGLQRIFCKCMHIVPRYCILVNNFREPSHLSMIEHFLRISNIIFARNYGIHHCPRKSDMSVEGPPSTWRTIFLWKEFLQLFFSLHRFLRNNNNTLSALIASCITQLMSMSRVVLPDSQSNPDSKTVSIPDIPYTTAYNRYTSDLIALFVWSFNT
ncbi:unnamed protein product [Cercopithifilaria johnstoni]|uniref:Uncharacterized protein n=1 Tax=Cercopithifilaria johnstoni TaxID=2874296 RepID=A0A8J2MB49_9BILA|nr:unnamed protein product [Cercopithifilaria johnstoni]